MRLLILLIHTLSLSLKSFSQTVIDSTVVRLKVPIAKEVIKDLLEGDAAKKEVLLLNKVIANKDSIIVTNTSIIQAKDLQMLNLNEQMLKSSDQLKIQIDLTNQFEVSLKKEKAKNKLLKLGTFGGIAVGVLTGLLIAN